MLIEQASLDDLPALCDLLNTLFTIEQDFHPDQSRQMRGLTLLLQEGDRAAIMVARDQDQVIGMVSAQWVISTAEGAPSAWVEDMVVLEQWRGQGTGRALLDHVLAWAREKGATRSQLLVDLDNAPALAYYDHLGWQSTRLAARRLNLKH